MKKIFKLIISNIVIANLISISAFAITPPKNWNNKWWNDGVSWNYIKDQKPVTGLQSIDNKLYYFDSKGNEVFGWIQYNSQWLYCDGERQELAASGWKNVNGKWYYFDSDAYMMHDTTTPDGYKLGSDGAWTN